MRRPRTQLLLTVVGLGAVVALAACSSDSNDSSSSTTKSTTSTTNAGSGGAAKAVVFSADNTKVGKIVVDDQGRTVYTLTDAAGKALPCQGSCLTAWPPVLLVAPETATGSGGVKNVSVVTVSEGKQVTVDGLPVYTFAGDAGPGNANGEGISSFGGIWHVVKVSGGASGAGTTETTKPATSSTTSDYGY
jgi:predicted lipoprotein with Yx(FWY)xxD motif